MSSKTLLIDETEFLDFQLFGIASNLNDPAQFVYQTNRHFETKFERSEDLDVLIEGKINYYPIFEWNDYEQQICYYIIKNTAYSLNNPQSIPNLASLFEVTPFLLNQYKQFNYLLKIEGIPDETIPFTENHFIQKIAEIQLDKVKSIDYLIF